MDNNIIPALLNKNLIESTQNILLSLVSKTTVLILETSLLKKIFTTKSKRAPKTVTKDRYFFLLNAFFLRTSFCVFSASSWDRHRFSPLEYWHEIEIFCRTTRLSKENRSQNTKHN